MSIVDTELWNLELNEISAEWLFNRLTALCAIYIADVDFEKAVLHCLHLMRNTALLFWWMHFMGRAMLEADVWLLWSAAPRENIAFSSALTTIPSLSPFFFFFFRWSHFVSTCLMFPGHQGAWERLFVIKETTEWVSVFTWTWLSCSGPPWCTVLDRTAGVFVLRLDYSTCIQRLNDELICFNCFLKIIIHSSLSRSKAMFIPLLIMWRI